MIVPPLPDKKYVGNLDNNFIEKRREELENFLKVIAGHQVTKNDLQLQVFLSFSEAEFEKYVQNPSSIDKMIGMYKSLPSIQNLSMASISNTIQSSIVTVKNEIMTVNEPLDLQV